MFGLERKVNLAVFAFEISGNCLSRKTLLLVLVGLPHFSKTFSAKNGFKLNMLFVAYAKRKKKVRISPDVVAQQVKIEEEKAEEKPQDKDKTSSQKPRSPVEEVKKIEDTDAVPTTNASKPSFDINEFFNEVDYYPPHMVIIWLQNVSKVLMINLSI